MRPKHIACVDGTNKKNVLWLRVKMYINFYVIYQIGMESAKIKIISVSQDLS